MKQEELNLQAIADLMDEYEPKQIAKMCYELLLELYNTDLNPSFPNLMVALTNKFNEVAIDNNMEPFIPMDEK